MNFPEKKDVSFALEDELRQWNIDPSVTMLSYGHDAVEAAFRTLQSKIAGGFEPRSRGAWLTAKLQGTIKDDVQKFAAAENVVNDAGSATNVTYAGIANFTQARLVAEAEKLTGPPENVPAELLAAIAAPMSESERTIRRALTMGVGKGVTKGTLAAHMGKYHLTIYQAREYWDSLPAGPEKEGWARFFV
jgi:hypothetical protein